MLLFPIRKQFGIHSSQARYVVLSYRYNIPKAITHLLHINICYLSSSSKNSMSWIMLGWPWQWWKVSTSLNTLLRLWCGILSMIFTAYSRSVQILTQVWTDAYAPTPSTSPVNLYSSESNNVTSIRSTLLMHGYLSVNYRQLQVLSTSIWKLSEAKDRCLNPLKEWKFKHPAPTSNKTYNVSIKNTG